MVKISIMSCEQMHMTRAGNRAENLGLLSFGVSPSLPAYCQIAHRHLDNWMMIADLALAAASPARR
jgi:hypothetical protein